MRTDLNRRDAETQSRAEHSTINSQPSTTCRVERPTRPLWRATRPALRSLFLLLLCVSASLRLIIPSAEAAHKISALIEITATPTNGQSANVNGDVRLWSNTNSVPTATRILTTNSIGWSSTNLYRQISLFAYAGPLALEQVSSNAIRLTARTDAALAVTLSAGWGTVTLSTNQVTNQIPVLLPLSVETNPNIKTNAASWMVEGINSFNTNKFLSQTLTNSAIQGGTIDGARITNATSIDGTLGRLTGGYLTNAIADVLTVTNLSSPGTGSGSFRVGASATASGLNSIAVGNSAAASAEKAVALGNGATASYKNGIAVGAALSLATNSIAIGDGAEGNYYHSIAIGTSVKTDYDFQIKLGGAAHTNDLRGYLLVGKDSAFSFGLWASNFFGGIGAFTNGTLYGPTLVNATLQGTAQTITNGTYITPTLTNATVQGTTTFLTNGNYLSPTLHSVTTSNTTMRGSNIVTGPVGLTRQDVASLANGNNAGVALTNVFVNFSGTLSAAATICGIAAGYNGQYHIIENTSGYGILFGHQSGTDPTAANRIITPTATDLLCAPNGFATVIYDTSASRWKLLGLSPVPGLSTNIPVVTYFNATNTLYFTNGILMRVSVP